MTDDDVEDGWDFGARQTPDRSMHSTTPSSFTASRVLLGDVSRSSSAQSLHPTKPQAEAKQLPPTPTDFEAEIEFYRRAANALSTSNLEQMASKEVSIPFLIIVFVSIFSFCISSVLAFFMRLSSRRVLFVCIC